jgi:hypothetical protein
VSPAPSTKNDLAVKEWQTARDVLQKFDDRIADLRKYGFSFVTALLTAQSLLVPLVVKDTGVTGVPDMVKFGVIAVTLLLVVTLRLLEKNYQLFQAAAAVRALILERRLNLELTETISQRYKDDHVALSVIGVYIGFAVGVGAVGGFILLPNYVLITYLIVLTALMIVALCGINYFGLHYAHGEEDWTVDPLECKKGEFVRITLTNLQEDEKKKISLSKGGLVCQITSEDGSLVDSILSDTDISISGQDSYSWLWNTGTVPKSGLYRVVPRNWETHLRRKIMVA